MKISIALSVLILAIGLATGFMHQRQLTILRQDREKLAAQALKLGLHVDSPAQSGQPKITKRQREERDNQTRSVSSQIIAFARTMEEHDKNGSDSDAAFQKQGMELMERLMDLDPEQLKLVIDSLRADQGISEDTRRDMIGFSIIMLAEDHPAAALSLFTASSDLMDDSDMGQQVIISSLGKWAKEDPRAALAWIEENSKNHPELADDDTKCSVLSGAAQTNPKLAFQLLSELGLKEMSGAIQSITEAGKTPEERAAILTAFRAHVAGINNPAELDAQREEALGGLARTISGESFDSVTKWVASQNLSPEESDQFAGGISYDTTKAETGKWIEWMSKTLPPDKLGERVGDLVGQWTQQDYLSAGKWLSAEPEGPAKTAAVKSYAETVAEYEPLVAAQWAMTMPAGQEREDTLKSIYENWPNKDAAAKAAFAAEHGITPDPTEEEN